MNFSVVIPLYNKSYSIKRCIDSVLSQTYTNFEIVIVNDGSTDDSAQKVIDNYSDEITSGKIIIISQPNEGVSVARNNGVAASSSEYVCFLDADDEWYDDFLNKITLLVADFPEAILYCLQHELKVGSNKPCRNLCYYRPNYRGYVSNYFKASLVGSIANCSKVCIRKEDFLELSGFPANEKSGEDLYFFMEVARKGDIAFYNSVSSRHNFISDKSRHGRNDSIPYPFKYYSLPSNKDKLNFWEKVYLRKVSVHDKNA